MLAGRRFFAIFVGLFSSITPPSTVWLKLDGDRAPAQRQNASTDYYGNVADAYFKVAELKGESLHIAQEPAGIVPACCVADVKLIPLTEAEIEGLRADRSQKTHGKLAATCDTTFIRARRPTTVEEILTEVEVLRDTDFDTFIPDAPWGGDKVWYPSKYGTIAGLEMDDFAETCHRNSAEAARELARKNINPMKVLIDGAHDMGIKVHVGVRAAGWTWAEPFSDFLGDALLSAASGMALCGSGRRAGRPHELGGSRGTETFDRGLG